MLEVLQFLPPEKYPIPQHRLLQKESPLATPTFSEKSLHPLKLPAEPLAEQPVLAETVTLSLEEALQMVDDPATSVDTLIQMLSLPRAQVVYNVCARIKQVLLVSNVQLKLQT